MLLSGGLIVLVLLIRVFIDHHGSFPGDHYAIGHFSAPYLTESAQLRAMNDFGSALGTPAIAILLVLFPAVTLWRRRDLIALEGLFVACMAVPANAFLKLVLGPTPDWVAAHFAGTNFPSGHTTFVTAVVGYLGVIAWRRGQKEIAVAAALLVLCEGPTRVTAGTHLVGDVVAGYCLGAAFLIAALTWVKWRSDTKSQAGLRASSEPRKSPA